MHVDASRYAVVGATNNKLKLTYPATSIRSSLVRTELLEAGIRHLILIAKEARQEAACIVLPKVAMTSVTVSSFGQGKIQNRITTFMENVFFLSRNIQSFEYVCNVWALLFDVQLPALPFEIYYAAKQLLIHVLY